MNVVAANNISNWRWINGGDFDSFVGWKAALCFSKVVATAEHLVVWGGHPCPFSVFHQAGTPAYPTYIAVFASVQYTNNLTPSPRPSEASQRVLANRGVGRTG